MSKIILGCANFGREYNGYKVPEEELLAILDYCREVGIDTLDTANAYDYWPPEDFKIINKVSIDKPTLKGRCDIILAHSFADFCVEGWYKYLKKLKKNEFTNKIGISLYPETDVSFVHEMYPALKVIQIPYKPLKSHLAKYKEMGFEIHVRKVFSDGCFTKAIEDENVDKVVIGVDTLKQLKENVERMKK